METLQSMRGTAPHKPPTNIIEAQHPWTLNLKKLTMKMASLRILTHLNTYLQPRCEKQIDIALGQSRKLLLGTICPVDV